MSALQHIAELTSTGDGYPPHWPSTMSRFPMARRELSSYVAVTDDGRPLGHVALHGADADSGAVAAVAAIDLPGDALAVVARLFVHPDDRRGGVARQLLGRAVTDAHARGLRPILDVWEQLAPAVSFYERCGWRRVAAIRIAFRSPCTERCVHSGSSISSYVYVGPALIDDAARAAGPDRSA